MEETSTSTSNASDVVSRTSVGLSEDLGEHLRDLRQARGLTQLGVATRLGITKSQVSQIERGHYTPSLKVLESYLGVLDARLTIELEEGGMFNGPDDARGFLG